MSAYDNDRERPAVRIESVRRVLIIRWESGACTVDPQSVIPGEAKSVEELSSPGAYPSYGGSRYVVSAYSRSATLVNPLGR